MSLPLTFTVTMGSGSYGFGKIDAITLNTNASFSTSGALSSANYPNSASFTTYPNTWTTTTMPSITMANGMWIQGSVPSGINYTNAVSVTWNVEHLVTELADYQRRTHV